MPRAWIRGRCRKRPKPRQPDFKFLDLSQKRREWRRFFVVLPRTRGPITAEVGYANGISTNATEITHENRSQGKNGAGDGVDGRYWLRDRQGPRRFGCERRA